MRRERWSADGSQQVPNEAEMRCPTVSQAELKREDEETFILIQKLVGRNMTNAPGFLQIPEILWKSLSHWCN